MKKIAICLALICLVALSGQAVAELCTIDARPAATLLVPGFVLDLDNPGGLTTLFSVNNASAAPQVAHVTVWTDWSVPVFDFDIYLSGYDVQTINVRDMLAGTLPQTGVGTTYGVDSPGTNQGLYSDPNVAFPNCNNSTSPGSGPYYDIPAFGDAFRGHVEAWLTGGSSPLTSNCAGEDRGNNIAQGYITIDVVNQCSLLFPSDHDAGGGVLYFGPTGVAMDNNVLWGDVFWINSDEDFAQGDSLVHIEASAVFEAQGGSPSTEGITFYGRYVDGVTGLDHREPLPTTLGTRHALGGAFSGGTDLMAWRSAEIDSASPVTCGSRPAYGALNQRESIIFDEHENPWVLDPDQCVSGDPTCEIDVGNLFPNELTIRSVDENPPFEVPAGWEFGWLYFNLNHQASSYVNDRAQAWITTMMDADGRFSVGYPALQLDNACRPNDFIIAVDNFM